MKVTKIRAGLYGVDAGNGDVFLVENRQAPADYGSEWLWYVTSGNDKVDPMYDPFYRKSDALEAISDDFETANSE